MPGGLGAELGAEALRQRARFRGERVGGQARANRPGMKGALKQPRGSDKHQEVHSLPWLWNSYLGVGGMGGGQEGAGREAPLLVRE